MHPPATRQARAGDSTPKIELARFLQIKQNCASRGSVPISCSRRIKEFRVLARSALLVCLIGFVWQSPTMAQGLQPVESTQTTAPKTETKDSLLKRMQGTWKISEATFNGKPFPRTDHMRLKIAADKYELTTDTLLDSGTLKVDLSTVPYQLDIEGTEGPNAGTKLACIVKFENEKMVVCYQLDGDGSRPSRFESPEGSAWLLACYERVPADPGR